MGPEYAKAMEQLRQHIFTVHGLTRNEAGEIVPVSPVCECGADAAKSPHSHWCPKGK